MSWTKINERGQKMIYRWDNLRFVCALLLCSVVVWWVFFDSPPKPDDVKKSKPTTTAVFNIIPDEDGDWFIVGSVEEACRNAPTGWSHEKCVSILTASFKAGDCDGRDSTVHPGASELNDGKDNDCDGEVDEMMCFTNEDCDSPPTGFKPFPGDDTFWSNGVDSYGCIDQKCASCRDTDQDGFCDYAP